MHVDAPDAAEKEPGEHAEGSDEPARHSLPGGQVVHWSALPRPSDAPKVLAGHNDGVALPSGQ